MVNVIEFFIFAILGWILDTLYTSIGNRKIILSGYFRGVPLCPIYGFGGILLINNFALMSANNPVETILVTTFLVITLELVGGLFSEHFLGEKLWDYSKQPLNLDGHISAWHSFLWLIAVSLTYLIIGRRINEILNYLNSKTAMDPHLEVIFLFLILVLALWVTANTKKLRLSRLVRK
jgi:uncharacterized membrane protein